MHVTLHAQRGQCGARYHNAARAITMRRALSQCGARYHNAARAITMRRALSQCGARYHPPLHVVIELQHLSNELEHLGLAAGISNYVLSIG
jgi:hypothetical protein